MIFWRKGSNGWVIGILASLLLPASVFASAPPRQTRRAQPILDGLQFQALALERSQQNHLTVRVRINGKEALLGVDTGAPISAISIQRRRYFGLGPIPGSSKLPARLQINGAFNRVAIAKHFQIGSLHLLDEPVVLIDLSNSTRAARVLNEEAIDGILGADILFPTSAIIDCQAQVLLMKLDPRLPGSVPGFDFRGLRAMRMRVSPSYNLYVDGNINGSPARFMVDTGAFATLMHRSFIRSMRIPTRATRYRSAGVNLGQQGMRLATLNQLSFGDVKLRRKEVGVMNLEGLIQSKLLDGKPPVAGLLGSEILRKHHGVIDFGTLTLYLER